MYLGATDPAVKIRQGVEVRIVKATVKALLDAGYALSVCDGEEYHPITTDTETLYKQLMETDEDYLFAYTPEQAAEAKMLSIAPENSKAAGWVRFIYGNDGYDVINDYTTNLEAVLKPVNELAENIGDRIAEGR